MGRTACTEPQCLYKGALYLTFTSMILLTRSDPGASADVAELMNADYRLKVVLAMILIFSPEDKSVAFQNVLNLGH